MRHFVDSVRKSLSEKNYYAALLVALTLVDICGRLENPNSIVRDRYIDWFNQHLQNKFTRRVGSGPQEHVFLNGYDFYALRCAYLHQSEFEITSQKAQKVLENFIFIEPCLGSVHMNRS